MTFESEESKEKFYDMLLECLQEHLRFEVRTWQLFAHEPKEVSIVMWLGNEKLDTIYL